MKAASATATSSAPAPAPAQNVEKLVPYVMQKWGKKVYIVAADYNYGQITAKWVTKYIREGGGEVVGAEFFPLDVTDFGATIKKIQAAKPDMVISVLVGGAHISFYRQWAAAGMKQADPDGLDHLRRRQREPGADRLPRADGIVVAYAYFQELRHAGQQGVPRASSQASPATPVSSAASSP